MACASSGPLLRLPISGGDEPWRVPESELGTQRLFRVRLSSPEGRGRFRLLLRLDSLERYRIDATHPLFNRRLWSLSVGDGEALLVDYLQKAHCRYHGEIEVAAVPLGPLAFGTLPALLLGYLPAAPVTIERNTDEVLEYLDADERRWLVVREDGGVKGWQLWRTADSSPVTWSKEGSWVTLSSPDDELFLRWRETVRETSPEGPRPLSVPDGSRDGPCDMGWIRGVEGTLADSDWIDE